MRKSFGHALPSTRAKIFLLIVFALAALTANAILFAACAHAEDVLFKDSTERFSAYVSCASAEPAKGPVASLSAPAEVSDAMNLTISRKTKSLKAGAKFNFKAKVIGAGRSKVKWSVSSRKLATIIIEMTSRGTIGRKCL